MFVFFFATDIVIHAVLLGKTYKELAHLWRPEAELMSFMPWMWLGQFIIAKFYVLLFIRGYEGKGITEGLRFGLIFIGPYTIAPFLVQYAIIPYPPTLIATWMAAGLVQATLAGVLVSLTYKSNPIDHDGPEVVA